MTRIPNDVIPEWCESSVYVDDGEIEALANASKEFWENYIMTDTPPMADGSPSTCKTIQTIYAESDGSSVSLMAYESDLRQYMAIKAYIDDAEKQKEEVANRIKSYMGSASSGESNGYKVSWASSVRNSFDHKKFAKDNPGLDLSAYFKQTALRTFKVIEL